MEFKSLYGDDLSETIYNDVLDCYNKDLTSLKGSQKEVGNNFLINNNKLTTLEYCPEIIKGGLNCSFNKLENFKYFPKILGGGFDCSSNNISSFQGLPKVINGNLNIEDNKIENFKYRPKLIKGTLSCSDNKITTLKNMPVSTHSYFLNFNELNTFDMIFLVSMSCSFFRARSNELEALLSPICPRDSAEYFLTSGSTSFNIVLHK